MRISRLGGVLSLCLLTLAVFVWAQAIRKPGLWEMTTTMNWQKTPLPPGMTLPAGANNPFAANTRTTQVCLTQAMIDKYGAPVPQSGGGCTITNISLHANSMTADMVCSGRMNGKGTLETTWAESGVAHGKVHFAGVMQMGQNTVPVEWTVDSTSTYKGPECGSVQPMPMPAK